MCDDGGPDGSHRSSPRRLGEALTAVDDAVAALERGEVIVIPTDTVYGLAARADLDDAVHRITTLKGRPDEKALQMLIPSREWLERVADPSEAALRLAERFWPGPLTIVVRAALDAPSGPVSEGTVGLRVPAHELALEIILRAGPVAASSANRSGEPTPSDVRSIRDVFGQDVAVYVDGGAIAGAASTVVDATGSELVIVRSGAIAASEIDACARGSI